ncbi:MAG: CBS domain-containing protein [Pirellulaceae bacterium]
MFHARDIMTTHIVTVMADDTIDTAIGLMVKHRISGLPVVDHAGQLVGIISEFDLLELICDGQPAQDRVGHFMSPNPCGVTEDDTWVTVVDLFRAKRVRRLPVLRDAKLVGIVTRHDLMHAIRDARRQIQRELTQEARQRGKTVSPAQGPAVLETEIEIELENEKEASHGTCPG